MTLPMSNNTATVVSIDLGRKLINHRYFSMLIMKN